MSALTVEQREWERIGENAPRWRDILKLCDEVERLEAENAAMRVQLEGKRAANGIGHNNGRQPDGTNRLCVALYGGEDVLKWLGGANAQMLHDAADRITELEGALS